MRHLIRLAAALLLTALPAIASAQAPSPALKKAAATITPADIKARIGIIADDSMKGRDTPSPGLEMTATYVANQFKKFGLKPAGENGTWFQRYKITERQLDVAKSHIGFMIGGSHAHAELSKDAIFVLGAVPEKSPHAKAILVGGPLTADDAAQLNAKGKVVLVVLDYSKPLPPSLGQLFGAIQRSEPAAVLLISNRDSAQFATRLGRNARIRPIIEGLDQVGVPVVEVHQRAALAALAAAKVNLDEIRGSSTVVTRDLPELTIGVDLEDKVLKSASAPNTIGVLEGTDPKLKQEYVVFSSHMDHVGVAGPNGTGGCQARGADSICNGADDDGSGTVGVIELAEAFSRPGARPKRSVLFITVSGEEKGLYGSDYFTTHPTIPLSQMVANINIDMIGRNWADTIVAIGKEHSDLGATLNRIGERHPELRMAPIDDRWPEESFYTRSDHFNFARKGVPVLFFFNGVHADYHQVSDSPDKIDAEKMSRIVQLLFYLGQDVANNPEKPKWNPESYEKIVEKKPTT
jgi:hypothetical protein